MDIQKVKELALANGFKLKEQAGGSMDLNAYVYDFANAIEQAAKAQAKADTKRIDFLADKSQSVANVMLPTKIVERNLSSLRDAIDHAMMIEGQAND